MPLRFMFHYYSYPERRLQTANLRRSKDREKAQPAAATKHEKRPLTPKKHDLQQKPRGIVLIRACSHFAALIRLKSWEVGVGLQSQS